MQGKAQDPLMIDGGKSFKLERSEKLQHNAKFSSTTKVLFPFESEILCNLFEI